MSLTTILQDLKILVAASITERDKVLCNKVMELLVKYNLSTVEGRRTSNLNIIVQSFNLSVLDELAGKDVPLVQLYDKDVNITESLLSASSATNVIGIGVTQ